MPPPERKPHYDTPRKSRVQGAHEYMLAKGIPHDPCDVFDHFMIKPGAPSRTYQNSSVETGGRKHKMTSEQVREVDHLSEDDSLGLEAKALPWESFAAEVGVEISGNAIRDTMKAALGYGKRLACVKGHQSNRSKEHRVELATRMLAEYPEKENWRHIRFSDKIHFGYGPEDQLRKIRKPSIRYRYDNLQHRLSTSKDDKHPLRKHCWAAVGYNFKSDIIFYDVPTNKNGKMTQKVYIDFILELVVKPWLEEKQEFVLEEDSDSGHGTGKANLVCIWKQQHGLKSYFNFTMFPNLALTENCWAIRKAHVRKYPYLDDAKLEELIYEGLACVSEEFINSQVDKMPNRLRNVINGNGDMTWY